MANELTLKGVKVKHKILGLTETVTDALQGEIFLSKVPESGTIDPHTGKLINPAYVARIGTGDVVKNDAGEDISELSWLHAPASDVHGWAKKSSITDVTEFAQLKNKVDILTGSGEGEGSISDQIDEAKKAVLSEMWTTLNTEDEDETTILSRINYTPATADTAASVTVTYVDGTSLYGSKVDVDNLKAIVGEAADYTALDFKTLPEVATALHNFLDDATLNGEVVDTLKEIQDFLQGDTGAVQALLDDVSTLKGTVGDSTNGLVKQVADLETYKTATLDPFFTGSATEAGSKAKMIADIGDNADAISTLTGQVAMFTHNDGTINISQIAGQACTTLIIDCN